MRPSKERLKEIRCKINEDSKYLNFVMSYEDGKMILAEIDALGAESKKLKNDKDELYADLIGQEHRLGLRYEIAEKERDFLKGRVAKLREALHRLASRSFTAKDEANYEISVWANTTQMVKCARDALAADEMEGK